MSRSPHVVFSRVSSKSQTVLPRDVRERLGIRAGDRLRYRIGRGGITIEKAEAETGDDPFATFTEWSSPDDEEAFSGL